MKILNKIMMVIGYLVTVFLAAVAVECVSEIPREKITEKCSEIKEKINNISEEYFTKE